MPLSKIIKADQKESNRISPLELEDLLVNRDIDASQADISGRKDRKPNIEEIKRAAFEEGLAQGQAEGLEMGRREAEPVIERFLDSLGEVASLKETIFKGCEMDVVELIAAAAEKIVQKQISLDKEVAAGVIKNALKSLTDRKELSVRINPADYSLIHERKAEYFGDIDGLRGITFIEDELVGAGGCMIESRFGELDARIEKQIESLTRGLKDALHAE